MNARAPSPDVPAPAGGAGLPAALAEAESVKAACAAVVTDLTSDAALMPSLYLVRGGRLRCQAVSRYWQVFDGIPPGAGVIGTTFASGEPIVISDTSMSEDYLEAVASVQAEVCVPIRLAGEVVGALNVESEQAVDGEELKARLVESAALLAERIAELGGLERESRAERLARHAAQLAGLTDAGAIYELVKEAACDIAEMDSALVALQTRPGAYMTSARGPHAEALEALPADALDLIFHWVESMSSAYTIGDPSRQGFSGHEPLRAAGAQTLVVLPLNRGSGGQPGVLLLSSSVPIKLDTEDIELLELLTLQAASCLGMAYALAESRERAERDALTGLGHHATFHFALGDACRRPPRPRLALLVADIDGFKAVNDRHGHAAGDRLLLDVARALASDLRADDCLYRIGGDEFAALIRVADSAEAEASAERLRAAVARADGPTVSVGVALHEPPEDGDSLFARADTALYRAKRAGRDNVAVG